MDSVPVIFRPWDFDAPWMSLPVTEEIFTPIKNETKDHQSRKKHPNLGRTTLQGNFFI